MRARLLRFTLRSRGGELLDIARVLWPGFFPNNVIAPSRRGVAALRNPARPPSGTPPVVTYLLRDTRPWAVAKAAVYYAHPSARNT